MKRVFGLVVAAILSISVGASRADTPLSFTWHNLAMATLKFRTDAGTLRLSAIPEQNLFGFFMPTFYDQYQGNEFKIRAAAPDLMKKARLALASWPRTPIIIIRSTYQLGEYDFQTQQFAFHPLTASSYFPSPTAENYSGRTGDTWPALTYDLFFTNPGLINDLQMGKDKAGAFLGSRTQFGQVDRSVDVLMSIKITDLRKGNRFTAYHTTYLQGTILDARVYSDSRETHLLQEYKAK